LPTLYIDIQLRLKPMNQSAYVVVKRCKTHINPIPERKFFEFLGQLARIRNPGAVHQDWDHRDIALKGRFDLDSDEIVRVLQTAVSMFVTRIEPTSPNDRKQHFALGNFIVQDPYKIRPKWNSVHVHEQNVGPKSLSKLVLDAARIAPGILTTIAKENFGHRVL